MLASSGASKERKIHMIKILFVCHGNICRSTMAEFVFKDMVKKQGLQDNFLIESKSLVGIYSMSSFLYFIFI